ncbi:major facilitator superfamily domain-containing protein [Chaetomium sp. MPI-SDFR-AT-0129]|nr:major facilitator superfamily domain-containing protein [Chaetomium sp. MPI-SDFR-AT-0129]
MRDRRDGRNGNTNADDIVKAVTEQTRLLSGGDAALHNEGAEYGALADAAASTSAAINGNNGAGDNPKDKPLPVWQIVVLCYARWIEPVAFFSIFPYVNQMAQENGKLADADVGFYSGLIESLFSLTQMFVMVAWGRAADRFGRKPVLVFSLLGVSCATALFGMATTIWQMVLFRCLAGVFAGTIVTIRTMISEHSTSKTQARAFSWFAFAGNLGILFGPLMGGALTNPARQYPALFGGIQFLLDYPYALPSFAVGLVGLSAVVVTALFVEETLPKPSPTSSVTAGGSHSEEESAAPPKPPKTHTIYSLLKTPGVPIVLYTYGHIMLLAHSYTAIVPVFWFTKIELGGFGFTPLQISLMLAVNGFAQATWILLVFPPMHARWGTNTVLRACAIGYPVFFVLFPAFNAVLRLGTPAAVTFFWITAPIALAIGSGISMSFTAIQLALNDVSPSPLTLGTLNALALALTSGLRAFSPALFASLFAVGARTQWLWGYAIWVLMFGIGLGFVVVSRFMPDYEELKRKREEVDNEEEES